MTDATALARAVIEALLRDGVREIVLAPGSRNAPLSFAAYDAERAGLVRLHVRIDERTAGFLALGLEKGGAHAAVVCTSGTAVANLHPAVLEAHHARLPLVVVTADRPARLRGTSANQTTDQVGIFGPLVTTVDLADPPELFGRLADPPEQFGRLADPPELFGRVSGDVSVVHLNVQLDEPLVTPEREWWAPGVSPGRPPGEWTTQPLVLLPLGPRTVVVAGDDAGPGARRLAEAARWPLLAEPSSGSRTGDLALRCYRLLLGSELADRVERVVVFGHPTLSRPVARLLGRAEVQVVAHGPWRHPFPVDVAAPTPPQVERPDDPAWLEEWRAADRSVSRRLDALLAAEPTTRGRLTAYHVAATVSAALPPGGHLVVGASNPIRDLDLMATAYDVGSRHKVVANRGLSGIDGTVSTAIGASLARPPESRNLALMGDVTFLHDANGLVIGPDEPRPDLTIVVVNDDGGSIFATLEQGGPAYADGFERLFATPHHVDLAALCAATRTPHWRVDSVAELAHALANPNGGVEVVEAVVDRAGRRDLDERIRALRP